jgi:hypothetical protein
LTQILIDPVGNAPDSTFGRRFGNRTGRFSRRVLSPRSSMLHRASVRRLFRSPRHQTAADHKRHQNGKKDSQLQIVRHAFLRVGEGRFSQGRGDYQRLRIDNAAINAAVPSAAVPWALLWLAYRSSAN